MTLFDHCWIFIFVSNPIVSSSIYKSLFLEIKMITMITMITDINLSKSVGGLPTGGQGEVNCPKGVHKTNFFKVWGLIR